ncbi:threonine synthase [Aquisalinus flavus]|uniref:Threonine synthase n=1 Tax=Aquisalinus flavus TaxID=1526572 RepID=A0A8J2Y4M5_9PROT|nr:threonine synthase [Aquisalinus flavus]MBD0426992.1 threonine synthase [Aquisalinus flavus]UNE46824.1 threonine synthase [Aquisalinus flavus]GGC97513.1 threonine synthase [Aquisalinus flavus]
MYYISTRGQAERLGFADVLLEGLAPDGGLYVPESWPSFTAAEIAGFAGMSYAEVATEVISRFTGDDIPRDVFAGMCEDAYASFSHRVVVPLSQTTGEDWILELFHGPTLAFKDVAMQLLGRLFDHVLAERGERLTIVGATSGDTGGAAIEALKGSANVDVFILHPHGRISEVQRRLMTCVEEENIHNIAIEGSFDDCQAMVKEMFADKPFREEMRLGAINSINWARIVAQSVYYFTSAVALGGPGRALSYCVPTGNFGDIFAAYVARQMGLPIETLCIATNENDILARTLAEGAYEPRGVAQTISPSMDIQVSSNFERLLFEASGRDAEAVRAMMANLKQAGRFDVAGGILETIRALFIAERSTETETAAMIREVFETTGAVIDPHTAVGLVATGKARHGGRLSGPVVTLATAHAAKFPDAVKQACGIYPDLPKQLSDLYQRTEKLTVLPLDQQQVQRFVASFVRKD